MRQKDWFGPIFLGSLAAGLGLFFWLVQKMPPVPALPPPVRLGPASLQAMADKDAAIADDRAGYLVRDGVVKIAIHNVTHPAYRPLESLSVGLTRYPKASHFWVKWGCYWGRHGSMTRAFYDRRTHRLVVRCVGGASPWGGFSKYTVFTAVTDAALRQDARDHNGSRRDLPFDGDVDIVFDDLPHYGCSQKLTKKWVQQA